MTITEIQTAVAARYRVTVQDMLSARRTERAVLPRHVAMWLARRETTASLAEIGRAFGDRDHTTVMHAIGRVETMRLAGLDLAPLIQTIRGEAVA